MALLRGSDAGGRCRDLCGLIHPITEHFDLLSCNFDMTDLGLQNHCGGEKMAASRNWLPGSSLPYLAVQQQML